MARSQKKKDTDHAAESFSIVERSRQAYFPRREIFAKGKEEKYETEKHRNISKEEKFANERNRRRPFIGESPNAHPGMLGLSGGQAARRGPATTANANGGRLCHLAFLRGHI